MAIAFDSSSASSNVNPGTSVSVSHTCTGSNLILWAATWSDGGDIISTCTYNSVAMTQAVKLQYQTGKYIYLYYLLSPTTGSNTLAATFSASSDIQIQGLSFTGVKQSGQPDATNSGSGTQAGGTVTGTVTSVADNCFAVLMARNNGGPYAAGTGMTANPSSTTGGNIFIEYTTSAITPAGSTNLPWSFTSGSTAYGWLAASFSPAVSAATTNAPFFLKMVSQ